MSHGDNDPYIDLVFVLDTTGSMDPYIEMAEQKIEYIANKIFESKKLHDKEDLRVGLVPYRDYVDSPVTTVYQFTSDIDKVRGWLKTLTADGGGDGPEAAATALQVAIDKMDWRTIGTSSRAVVLITDAPPHGIDPFNKYWDSYPYPGGDPDPGYNPLRATSMKDKLIAAKIKVFIVQCEPTLTNEYGGLAVSFYKGLAHKTNGRVVALPNADGLANSIIGYALETIGLKSTVCTLGGKSMSDPTHKNFAISQRLLALAGVPGPSQAEKEQWVKNLYEDWPDNLDDIVSEINATHTPDSALADLKTTNYLGSITCWGINSNVDHSFSEEGKFNLGLFMNADASGNLPGSLKEDTGTALTGNISAGTITLSEGALKGGQIKRLAFMYAQDFYTT